MTEENRNDTTTPRSVDQQQACSPRCRRCGGKMKEGVCLVNGIYGSEDFGGDFGEAGTTMSEGPGDGKPRRCLKCEKCGHSMLPANVRVSDSPGQD